jgi:hypothetical protein
MSTELIERTKDQDSNDGTDTLMLLGGAALVIFGAGLILSTPAARGLLGGLNLGNLLGAALPKDVQRYIRMRSM